MTRSRRNTPIAFAAFFFACPLAACGHLTTEQFTQRMDDLEAKLVSAVPSVRLTPGQLRFEAFVTPTEGLRPGDFVRVREGTAVVDPVTSPCSSVPNALTPEVDNAPQPSQDDVGAQLVAVVAAYGIGQPTERAPATTRTTSTFTADG